MNDQFEFSSVELRKFEDKIFDESEKLIQKMIKQYSPIQINDVVIEKWSKIALIVTTIKLFGIDSWDSPFCKMSFTYEGLPLKKNGTPIKNRKPIWFSSFIFNGKNYHMPSYCRKQIIPATIIKNKDQY